MKKKPLVAVIGRPNVGKSTFFNRIAGRKIAIVENRPGITRDRLFADVEWCGYNFTAIDTGGLEVKSNDVMWSHIRRQVEFAAETADLILFLTDGKSGVLPEDYDVADFIRKTKKPCVLAVNKVDNRENEDAVYDFYSLGLGTPFSISAEQGKGIGDLLDEITGLLKEKVGESEAADSLKIAVIGRPNAGKSSIVNRLLGFERVIVSDRAGTTRDAVDTDFRYKGVDCTLVDTAGIRKKKNVDEDVEYYSVLRAFEAVRRADVVLIVMDAAEDIGEQDVRLAGYVHERGKPSLIVMNKWDKVEKDAHTVNKFNAVLKEDLKFMDYFAPVYVSAASGQRVKNIMPEVLRVYENSKKRVTTGVLNDVIREAVSVNEPPSKNGRRLKIYFATEALVSPPTFVFFVNDADLVHFSYKRYLENSIRAAVDFSGTPIRLEFKEKNEKEAYD
ncbi:MAG: ribosome biogenesis GTPase Der [Clostridiales bacterium]|jgi:GTP-binding protein|nr:ribosome biogenesis GTPase Der [Clostridiales bacterium]